MTKMCPVCQQEFNAPVKRQVCCSRTCARRLEYAQGRGSFWRAGVKHNRPRRPETWGEEKFCPTCGERFRAAKKVVHCSHSCAMKARHAQLGTLRPEGGPAHQRYRERMKDDDWQRRNTARRHGMTLAQYDELWERQDGLCAICKIELTGSRAAGRASAHVDHNHDTGEVRGMLCLNCNHMIGKASDNPAVLRAGADYLDAPRIIFAP